MAMRIPPDDALEHDKVVRLGKRGASGRAFRSGRGSGKGARGKCDNEAGNGCVMEGAVKASRRVGD